MKTLILMRHGKSSWEHDVSDKERPLKPRGLRDSGLVAKEFISHFEVPESIFSSPANRAFSTCQNFIENTGNHSISPTIVEDLYDFGGQKVINFISSLDDSIKKVMIFGHNFAFTNIANALGDSYIDNLPTAGLVVIEFNTKTWANLGDGRTVKIIIPKDLR